MKSILLAFILPCLVVLGCLYFYEAGYDAGIKHTLRNIAYERNRGESMPEVINIVGAGDDTYVVKD